MRKFKSLLWKSAILVALSFAATNTQAQLVVNPGGSTDDIIQTIIGSGVTYSNVSITCPDDGYGVFSGGNTTPIGIDEGVILTTGHAADAPGPNNSPSTSETEFFPGDADLEAIIGAGTNDACILEFDFEATTNNIGVNFVFASEEYEEYVCSQFNDVFAFLISGPNPSGGDYVNENLALIGTSLIPVAINNVNNGNPGNSSCVPVNPDLYINNPDGSADIQYDGFTVVFNASTNIVIGETYHFKIAIADVADASWDSGVFIEGQSFTTFVCDPGAVSTDDETEFCNDEAGTVDVFTSSGVPGDYAYVLTDDSGEILAIQMYPNNQFDLDGFAAGSYSVFGLSWDGGINGLGVGNNINDLFMDDDEECYELSDALVFTLLDCFEGNPDLDAVCGDLNVVFVLDESGSIDNDPGDEAAVKAGVLTIANGLLDSDATLRLIEFDTEADLIDLGGTLVNNSLIENLDDYLNSNYNGQTYSPGGWTNWEDAMNEVEALADVNLVIFFTDGNPTAYNSGGGTVSGNDATTMAEALAQAIDAANAVKAQGKHLFVVGVGDVNAANLPLISDTDEYNPPAVDIFTGDFTIESYATLANCLEQTILDVCGTELVIEKTAEYNMACFGEELTFIIEVTNTGNPNDLETQNLVVTDTVPNGYSNLNLIPQAGLSIDGNIITFDIGTLASGASASFSFTAVFEESGDYLNEAWAEGSNTLLYMDDENTDPEVCCQLIVECPDEDGGAYECVSDIPSANNDLIIIIDSCEDPEIIVSEESSGEGCVNDPYILIRTYSVTSGDESATCTQTFTAIDNVSPVLSNVPQNMTIDCNDELPTDMPDISDNCDDSPLLVVDLVYEANDTFIDEDPDDCQLRTQTQGGWGSPANGNNPGVYRDANFDAAFPGGLVVGCTHTLTLTSASAVQEFLPSGGSPAALTGDLVDPSGQNVFGGQIVALALSIGFDNNDPDFGESSSSLESLIINNGTFNGWTVGELFDLANDIFGGCDDSYSASTVSDALAMINENFVDGIINLGNLDCDGEENICEYNVIRVFTGQDYCGNIVQAEQVVTVVDNSPPVLTNLPEDATYNCDETIPSAAIVGIEDNCDDNPTLTFEELIVPVDDCIYEIWRFWEGYDECLNMVCFLQVITIIDDEAPILIGVPGDLLLDCTDPIPSAPLVTAEDNCDEDILVDFDEVMNFDECPYTITRTWTASDYCGNDVSETQVITINDTTDPVIVPIPAYIALECDDLSVLSIEASDDCDEDLEITYDDLWFSGGGCYGILERTWYATDNCGNYATATQIVELVDTIDPVFIGVGGNMEIECSDDPIDVPDVTVEDNCTEELELFFSEEITPGNCPHNYIITWTWTAEDECGNVGTATQIITVSDTTPPELGEDAEFELPCDQYPPLPDILPTDNCSELGNIDLDFNEITEDGECGGEWIITRTWTATDECDNSTTLVHVYYGFDDVNPVFELVGEDAVISCDEEIPVAVYEVSDNCSDVDVNVQETIEPTECPSEYTILRSYTAIDGCQNTTVHLQTIVVEDNEAPVLSDNPGDLILECTDPIPDVPEITANDNCDEELDVVFEETYSEENPEPGAESYCVLENPIGQDNPEWSLVLFEMPTPNETEYYNTVEASWAVFADEGEGKTAHLTGRVVSSYNENAGWDFDVWFYNGEDWDAWSNEDWLTSYKDDQGIAGDNYLDWMYYLVNADESYMTGWGDLEGSMVNISHAPPNLYFAFQEGVAANNTTDCYGVGGWIHYEGLYLDSYNDVEEEVSAGGDFSFCSDCCPIVNYDIYRTWTATDCAGNVTTYTQTISIIDDEAPVLSEYPESVELACGEDVPDAPIITALDNCSGEVDVYFEEEIIGPTPPEDALSFCEALDPIGQEGPEWSLVLFEMPTINETEYYTTVEAYWATFEGDDGKISAHLYGSVVSSDNENAGWDFSLWFYNGENWDDWQAEPWLNSYKDDQDMAGLNYLDWMYYLVNADESFMVGWGDLEGSYVNISHAPPNLYFGFQEGVAANNTTDCYGVGGWIHYEGIYVDSYNNIEEEVSAGGDFSFCLDCCPDYEIHRTWTAEDCAGNVETYTQVIVVNSGDMEEPEALGPPTACDADFDQNGVVNVVDMVMLSSEFGCHEGCECDIDSNGHVDILDMIIFSSMYGSECIE